MARMDEATGALSEDEPLAPTEAAADVTAASAEATEERFRKLEVEVRRLWNRGNGLRHKIFAIQQAVVEEMGLTECTLGHPAADIFPVEVHRDPTAPTRVLAFGSMGARSGMAPREFFNSLRKHHCEIYFFKDFRQCWYQQGLLGLSSDIASTAEYLQKLLGEDSRPVSMVGASSGGFAALMFGTMLGANKIVAFSPQTLVTHRVFNRFKTEDSEIGEIDFQSRYADVKAIMEHQPLKGRADIYFSRRSPFDAAEAQRLEGLPQVNLRPLEWHGHNTAALLRNQGRLDDVMADLVAP